MNRIVRIPTTGMACVLWAGLALAQTAPPTQTAARHHTGSGPRWQRALAGRDWSAGARASGGRHPSSDPGGDGAGQRPRQEVHRRRVVVEQDAAEEIRAAADAAAAAQECRRHLYADRAAAGNETRGVRRDREEGEHRSAAARRLHHRLVGAGRRQQGDVREVLRRDADGELRGGRRYDPGSALGAPQRRRAGLSAEGDHADDRHEQRRQHRT